MIEHYPWKSKGFWGGVILIGLGLFEIAQGYYESGIYLLGVGLGLVGIRAKLERDL